MALNQMLRHSKLTTHCTYLVFEKQTQRLAKLQIHLFRKSAHIVMALDGSAGDRKAFDTVRIDCSLRQPFHILDFMSFGIKHIDESLSDNLALAFRLCHSFKLAEELL